MPFDDEGRWDIHFLQCGGGCHHLTQVDIADSREGFQTHLKHITKCNGWMGWNKDSKRHQMTPEELVQEARSCTPITEHEARHRFETKCPEHDQWNANWHLPHTWHSPSRGGDLNCYGLGLRREVPELPSHVYTLGDL
jgi:hypothetical protein